MSDSTRIRSVPLGRTKIKVTNFGLGSAQFGWMFAPVPNAQATATFERAIELGIRFFDTSPLYGRGIAESRLGKVLPKLVRESFALSSKVGYAIEPDDPVPDGESPVNPDFRGQDFSYDFAMRSLEGTLKRTGLSRLDILLIHDPDDQMEACLAGTYRAIRKLRDEGVIGAIGAGMNDAAKLAWLARRAEFDCFLMAGRYTLIDQEALIELLPLASEQGLVIYVGGPFNSGLLADPFAANPKFNYDAAGHEWVDKAQRVARVCTRHGVDIKSAALQFPLGHPAVVSVVSGARSVVELEQNVAAFNAPVSAALWADLKREGLLGEHVPTPDGLR